MKPISELVQNIGTQRSKHDYEFQEICVELEKSYGKRIWRVPYFTWVTEHKLRKAAEIAKERGKEGDFGYLVGIIKKLV